MVAETKPALTVEACDHAFTKTLDERWTVAENEDGIGVCTCCEGPLRQVRAPVSDYIPGAPESWGYIGIKDRCARCPE